MLSVRQLARNGQYRSAKLAGGQCLRSPQELEILGDPDEMGCRRATKLGG